MARLIPVCGRPRWVHPTRPPYFTVRELQELVRTDGPESWIEVLCDFKYGNIRMLASEDGRLNGLAVNDSASILACREVRGDVLLLTEKEFDDLDLLWTVCYTPVDEGGPPAPMQFGFDFEPPN
jgi:hypothetical protein